jgi:hypothetical protein
MSVYTESAMPLSIRNVETTALARRLAARTGKTVTQTIHDALQNEELRLGDVPKLKPETERFLKELNERMNKFGKRGPAPDKAFFDSLYDE